MPELGRVTLCFEDGTTPGIVVTPDTERKYAWSDAALVAARHIEGQEYEIDTLSLRGQRGMEMQELNLPSFDALIVVPDIPSGWYEYAQGVYVYHWWSNNEEKRTMMVTIEGEIGEPRPKAPQWMKIATGGT